MPVTTDSYLKQRLLDALERLPEESWEEVLDFVLFLRSRAGRTRDLLTSPVGPGHLDGLTSLVSWGGDALSDSEGLYDGA